MVKLSEPTPDHAAHTETMRLIAVHLLARARHAATGRFGLRPTPGGLGTGRFGPDNTQVRMSGATLVHETAGDAGASTRTLPVDGRTFGELAAFVGVDLVDGFSVGHDTPDLPGADHVVRLDDRAATLVGDWYAFCDCVLIRFLAERPDSTPTGLQVWPEHFDLGTDLDATPGGERMNVGGSPGDSYSAEPYLYVGPRSTARPGDPDYWNAPFGAAIGLGELAASGRPDQAALEFLRRGASLLTEA